MINQLVIIETIKNLSVCGIGFHMDDIMDRSKSMKPWAAEAEHVSLNTWSWGWPKTESYLY